MNIEGRMSKIEAAVALHLEESGGIRTDLKWLKHAFWTLTGAVVAFCGTFAASLIIYLLRR